MEHIIEVHIARSRWEHLICLLVLSDEQLSHTLHILIGWQLAIGSTYTDMQPALAIGLYGDILDHADLLTIQRNPHQAILAPLDHYPSIRITRPAHRCIVIILTRSIIFP